MYLLGLVLLLTSVEALRFVSPLYKQQDAPQQYPYKIVQHRQVLDHFNLHAIENTTRCTFQQRLLINSDSYEKGGPILFYTGNEGDITLFAQNTGFMFDIAPQFGALVVFAEHRYYGESLPFGNESFSEPAHTKYLTVEQALADFVEVLKWVRTDFIKDADAAAISFGGSYGGMLAAWLRMSYPSAVQGAIAGSAPVWMFPDQVKDCTMPYQLITNVFTEQGDLCSQRVGESWDLINKLGATAKGRRKLTKTFKLCKPMANPDLLTGWLGEMYFDMAMVNYPYPTSFLSPLPAWPVKEFCKIAQDGDDTLDAIAAASQIYYNHTGEVKCLDVDADPAGGLGMQAWEYQACMELILPICSDPSKDMFPKQEWDNAAYLRACEGQWKSTARPNWLSLLYGGVTGYDYSGASNIFWSNGNLDPWSVGGVLESPCRNCPVYLIMDGAHHLDLRGAMPEDPMSVKLCRNQEIAWIKQWIKDHNEYVKKGHVF